MRARIHERSPLPPAELVQLEFRAEGQERAILEFFRRFPGGKYTPPEVLENTRLGCPLTSVRRALTNLTRQGLLAKDEGTQRRGRYGVSNCTWYLAGGATSEQRTSDIQGGV